MAVIYYIEDDKDISQTVSDYFEEKGSVLKTFPTIKEAKQAISKKVPMLVLVDWNLPDGDGKALCKWIRSRWEDLPVIFLTVRSDSGDIIDGLNSGADDYVVKPFDLDVLYSRVQALLRRTGNLSSEYLSCGNITIDCRRKTVFKGSSEITLSSVEYQLLLILMKNKGRTVTREVLLKHIWDDKGNIVNDNTLTVTVKRLRNKLNQTRLLKTIRSVGYRMEEEE